MTYFENPVSVSLNFTFWITLIYDKITWIYRGKKQSNPTSKVQKKNGALKNHFENSRFKMGVFKTGFTVASGLVLCANNSQARVTLTQCQTSLAFSQVINQSRRYIFFR